MDICFILVLLALVLLVHFPAMRAGPIFDDLQLWAAAAKYKRPARDYLSLRWRLLPQAITWGLFRAWGAASPWLAPSFRLANTLLHLINAILLYKVARELGLNDGEAHLAALVFALHPLATAATHSLIQQAAVLATTFTLASILMMQTGHPLLAGLVFSLAILAKEDALASLPVVVVAGTRAAWLPLSGTLFLLGLASQKRFDWRKHLRNNGDAGMARAHMPVSLEQPAYTATAITENLRRFPLWIMGFGQSVHPKITVRSTRNIAFRFAVVVLVGIATLYIRIEEPAWRLGLALVFASPWTGSWLIRLPDPVMEYRAYASLAGVALLAAPLAHWPVPATLYIAWLAVRAAQRSFFHRHPVPFWLSAWASGSQTAKVALNIGSAFQAAGRLPEALEWHRRTLELDPLAGVAAVNIGLLLETQARLTGQVQWLPEALASARSGRKMCPHDPLVVQYAGLVEERCRAAGVT